MKKLKRFVITDADCFIKGQSSDDPHIIPLNELNFDRLADFTENNRFPVMHEFFMADGCKAIRPARYAGIITLKDGTQIELMPQICLDRDENALVSKSLILRMLQSMLEIPVRKVDELYFKKEQLNIFEICVRMFTDEVLDVVRGGLKQTYVPYQGNEMFVKGKTIYSEHAKRNYAHKEKFFVEYDVFSTNRAENRLIKSTLRMLGKLSTNTLNLKKIKMLLPAFDGIDFSLNVYKDFKAVIDDRSMSKYTNAMQWCRLFLLNKGTTTFFCGGKVSYAMLFPIDKLFCACIATSLRKQINREKYYFMTPEKMTNSLSNTSLDLNMEPVSNFYVKSKADDSAINIVFKFYDFNNYHGIDDGNTAVVFPVTEVLNRKLEGIKKNMYLVDLKDIDGSVSVLNETFFL
ncbi:MAG: McrC family protein [Oscillospiraceae bacterium]|nr:McrC family protein [Oscillospiraceae bacterium]